jgi:hypothetical protein
MVELSNAHYEHLADLLKATEYPRDAVPYTQEFDRLKQAFYDRTFKKLTDSEFWRAMLSAAKKGGVRGKASVADAPDLTEEQVQSLLKILPVPLGQRDRLPYTEAFDRMVRLFNSNTGLQLSHRDVWLALLRVAK